MSKQIYTELGNHTTLRKKANQVRYKLVKDHSKGKVLELGCGTCEFVEDIPNYIGVDINADYLKKARQKGFKVFKMDIERLKFKKDSFDTVICIEVIEHLEKSSKLLSEIRRVLKHNGILILSTPNIYTNIFNNNPYHKNYFSLKELHELLDDFKLIHQEGIFCMRKDFLFSSILKFVWDNFMPLRFHTSFIIIAKFEDKEVVE